MRTIPALLLAEMTAPDGFLIECALVVARDGSRLGFTTHVDPIALDLGVDDHGADDFTIGMTLSALTMATGLDAGHAELRGAIDDDVTLAALLGRKWTGARAWLVQLSPGIDGFAPLMAGRVRDVTPTPEEWTMEIRGHADAFNQVIGDLLTPFCKAELGDPETCKFTLTPVAATVTAVVDPMRFTVSFSGTFDDDHFNLGKGEWLTGDLAGTDPVQIFNFISGGAGLGALEMFEPLAVAPQVGDTLNLFVGCPKMRSACRDLFGNILNFRGYPEVPGTPTLLRAPGTE